MPATTSLSYTGHPALLPLRNALFLGSYGVVISKAMQVHVDPNDVDGKAAAVEKETLVYRAHIGQQQYDLVLSEIKNDEQTPIALRAVFLLAKYFSSGSDKEKQDAVVQEIDQLVLDASLVSDATLAIVAATVYMQEGKPVEALKFVYTPTSLEMGALKVVCYLQMDLLSEALDAFKELSEMNDEATITLLIQTYVLLAQGGEEKLQEATNILQLLIEKFGETSILLNAVANIAMQQGKFQEAESSLMNAISKKSNDPDTLVNLISCSNHLKRPRDTVARSFNQLKTAAPNHPFVKGFQEVDAEFDKLVAQFNPTK